ncbi:S8 family serine peptidase [Candidatus Falkowbacteria bacterium]|nr:S8 family serine peptidase [Candidatus Falkowbacteria bacterium]
MVRKFGFTILIAFLLFGIGLIPVFAYLPADDFYGEQWYLRKVKAQQAWDFTRGSEDIVVAVLDSGIDLDHPDLKENIWTNNNEIPGDGIDNDNNGYVDDFFGWDFVGNDNWPEPDTGDLEKNEIGVNHGTVIAGIIGAKGRDGAGIAGMNWNSKIMSLRILNNDGLGNTLWAIQAIDYAVANGADIINMSLAGTDYSRSMYEAVKRAWDKDILIVTGGGTSEVEEGDDLNKKPWYPIAFDEFTDENMVIGVVAVDKDDKKLSFENYGQGIVDIVAPGYLFFSTVYYREGEEDFSKYHRGYFSGSSLSAALVSGVASLIKSLNPSLSNEKIRDVLLGTADNVNDKNPDYGGKLGKGRLNAYKALDAVYKGYFNTQASKNILAGSGMGRRPEVKIFDSNGVMLKSFLAYGENFRGGVKAVGCDLDNDNVDEIVTGTGFTGGPHIKIFKKTGELVSEFFAFDDNFRGGVNVACGDVDKDGRNEIVTASGPTGEPYVRVFESDGKLVNEFLAFGKNFTGGVNLTVRDLDKNGKAEIFCGPASGGGPMVRIFDYEGKLLNQFFAFSSDFRGGIDISVGDLNKDKEDEIVVTIIKDNYPYVRVFNSALKLEYQFLAYNEALKRGVSVVVADLESDGAGEIVVGPVLRGGQDEIWIYNIEGKKLSNFSAFSKASLRFGEGMDVGTVGSN